MFSLCFSGCSKEDEPENSSSSTVTINGIKAGKFLYTVCEISYPAELALEAHFDYADEGIMSFDMAVESIKSLSQLRAGMDITDDIEIYKFYSMSGAFVGHEDYEVLGGSAKITSVSSDAVVVKFNKFRFLRELGNNEQEFIVNGTISYTIND